MIEISCVAIVVNIFNTFPQLFVKNDAGRVLRHHRSDSLRYCHKFIITIGIKQCVEHAHNSCQVLTTAFECHDSVFECRIIGIGGDFLYFSHIFLYCPLKSGFVICFFDFVERNRTICGFEFAHQDVVIIHI